MNPILKAGDEVHEVDAFLPVSIVFSRVERVTAKRIFVKARNGTARVYRRRDGQRVFDSGAGGWSYKPIRERTIGHLIPAG